MRWEQHYDWRRGIVYGGGQEPGKQSSFQTQNTTTTSEPSPILQPGLKQIAGNFMDNFNPTRPSFFPGEMVAPLSGQTQTGISNLFSRGANGSPLMRAGDSSITDTLGGKFLDPGNNPYLQKYLRAGLDQQNDSFNALTVPGIRSQFAGSGRNLGGLDVDAVVRARNNLDRAQADATAGAEAGAYQGERTNQMNVLGMVPTFANQDYQDINAMLSAGGMTEQQAQKYIDENVARYNYNANAQPEYLARMAQLYQSMYPGGTTSGTGTSSGYSTITQPSNPTSSILGAGLGAAGLGLQLAKFLPWSDRRLKTDIKPVGKTYDGQNIYSYRFLGEPHHQIGLMAQEVEKRRPDAVQTDRAGWKHVDDGRATAHAAPAGGLR
jgi:Chaperone of endosialidase